MTRKIKKPKEERKKRRSGRSRVSDARVGTGRAGAKRKGANNERRKHSDGKRGSSGEGERRRRELSDGPFWIAAMANRSDVDRGRRDQPGWRQVQLRRKCQKSSR